DRMSQGPFFVLLISRRLRCTCVFAAVLLFLNADDVSGPLVASEQVLAVLGVEKLSQRLDALDNEKKIVLAFEREHGINEIVPCALLAKLDFEAFSQKRQKRR